MKAVFYLAATAVLFTASSCKKEDPITGPLFEAKVFVAVEDGQCITVINAVTDEITNTISFNDGSGNMMMVHNVQASPDGKSVWATINPFDPGSVDQLAVIDPVRETVTDLIDIGVGMQLAHIVFDERSQYAFVTATDSDLVIQVNTATHEIERKIFLGAGHMPHGMRCKNDVLYVANMGSETISAINILTGNITEIPAGGMAVQTAITRDGKFVFASVYDMREVLRYEVLTGEAISISLPAHAQGPVQLYPSPNGQYLYVCDQGVWMGMPASDQVFVIDINSGTVIDSVTAGTAPHGVVVSRDGKKIYVTNNLDNSVSVIDAENLAVTATVHVGMEPNGITWWSTAGVQP